MKDYYIIDANGQQTGPFPGKALKLRGVTPDTFVWCDGMGSNWAKAGDIDELKPLFAPKSAPANSSVNTIPNTPGASPVPGAFNPSPAQEPKVQEPYEPIAQQPQQTPFVEQPREPHAYGQPAYGQQPYGQQSYEQQSYGQQPQLQTLPNNFLPWAILVTFCCCLPGGIVAMIYASKVNGKLAIGDYQGALQDANSAKTWCIISAIVGLIVSIGPYIAIIPVILEFMEAVSHF